MPSLYGPGVIIRCDACQQPARVVEVNDHGRLFYGIDCPRCGLYVPHAVAHENEIAPATRHTSGGVATRE